MSMELYAVKINGLTAPLGYHLETPLCSWKVRGAKGKCQKKASVEVAVNPDFSEIVYQVSGELNSLGVPLKIELAPYTRYYFRVTVNTDAGETVTSETHFFETAKLSEPWEAKWLGMKSDGNSHPEFRKTFSLHRRVSSARLYISGLGIFEAYLGGKKVGSDMLAPFINDYQEHIQYCSYDVTQMLRAENELTVILGNGWYRGRFGLSGGTHYDRAFCLISELRITYADGSTETISTDESWQVRESVITFSDIYDGETQEYTHAPCEWQPAQIIAAPVKLVTRYSPPLHPMEVFTVKEVIHTPNGETVLDFGQNLAGYVECTQPIPEGNTMQLEFGETMQGGNFYHDNYRTAKSIFTYISDGKERMICPHFTFFGFRYVKVSGLEVVDPSRFTARALYSEMDRTGFLETGNQKINRLHENVLWGLKSNFLDMPTDCPQRDERLGWCGDAQVFCPTAGYLMDTRAFYHKFLRDLRSDQLRNGGKAAIYLPNEFPGLCAAVWSDIATFLPKMLYSYYGSKDMLARYYPLMKDWVDSIRREDQKRGEKYLWDFGFQFGDWLALDGATEQSTFGRTDSHFISSAYYYASVCYVAKAAAILGSEEEAAYTQLAQNIRDAILREYFTPNGRLSIDTQTGYLVALKFGIHMDRQRLIDGLKARIKKDCNRIKGGFVGATMMNTVLAENDMVDMAYDFLFYEGFPGWLYAVDLGATTIWERWNSVLPDGSISGTGMNSLNHYSYGSVMEFVYRHAAGIAPLEPGFRRARIAPKPDARLGHLDCCFDSACGAYVSRWSIEDDGGLRFHIEIPFGCEAEVELPEQETAFLPSGSYDFHICTKRDYLALYSGDTPMERLLADDRAVAVLDEYLPGTVQDIDREDAEAMSKSLNDMRNRAILFRTPTEQYDQTILKISTIRAQCESCEIQRDKKHKEEKL